MKYEEYLAKRNQLMTDAQNLADQSMYDEAEAKQNEVTALDEQWDKQAKYEANQAALNGQQRKVNVQNLVNGVIPTGLTAPVAQTGNKPEMTMEDALNSDDYVNAWAKKLMAPAGKEPAFTDAESKAYHMVNDAIQTNTETIAIVIPNNISQRIIRRIEELHPLFGDITKTFVKGNITLIVEDESSDAQWYKEETPTAEGTETLATISLGANELARAIKISWKLKEMTIPDFLNYIVDKMSKKMGAAFAYGIVSGKGTAVSGTNGPEPKGIITELLGQPSTPQVVAEGISYESLTKAKALINSVYNETIYANKKTIWTVLANILDANGRPIFMADAINGGVYKIFGSVVKEEAAIPDGEVLFADASAAYTMNINKQISLMTDEDIIRRTTTYAGYAIADGAVVAFEAAALVKNA